MSDKEEAAFEIINAIMQFYKISINDLYKKFGGEDATPTYAKH